jgi:site-specific DNA-methyltransferase (adenine-specific)
VNISAKRTKKRATYNPQGVMPVRRKAKGVTPLSYLSKAVRGYAEGYEFTGLTNCPTDILRFPKETGAKGDKAHPFAKPVALLEHLIRTYSNPDDLVLDNTMGGGSTCLAAMNTARRSIGIEIDREWFELACQRIDEGARAGWSRNEAA